MIVVGNCANCGVEYHIHKIASGKHKEEEVRKVLSGLNNGKLTVGQAVVKICGII